MTHKKLMAKEDNVLRLIGTVDKILPNAMFKVMLENNHCVTAYLGGKMRKNDIKIIAGDEVEIEMSPYDMTKGRVIYRKR
jgi:translation initiation factor IF-1